MNDITMHDFEQLFKESKIDAYTKSNPKEH